MQKLMLSVLALFLSVTVVVAQTGEDAFKEAKKSFDKYELNQDAEALSEAVSMLETSMESDMVANDPKALIEAGDIYKAAINQYVNQRILDDSAKERSVDMPATKAAKAYLAAFEKADKSRYKKDALKGLSEIQGNLTNEGIYFIQDGKDDETYYNKSYTAFSTNLMVTDFLNENGGEVLLEDEAVEKDKYFGALAAVLGKDYDSAQPLFEELYANDYEDAGVYDGLFQIYSEKGMDDKASEVLAKGREKYPNESSLLFSEINYLLKQGRLDELTTKLEQAIKAEPDNMSLYATLAQVYEQLYRKSSEEGNEEKASEYFNKAEAEYNRGLEKDPNSAKMIYGLGAMIYNRAAGKSQQLVELGNDFSKEGQKKYEALKEEVDGEFAKALPFFKKAEMKDPSDVNTLIALKEMYARTDDYEISGEFKKRIEAIQGGGTVEKSYFEENGMD